MAGNNNVIRGESNNTSNSQQTQKSEYMLLIGTNFLNEETDQYEFISLPQPVGLDTMKMANVSGEGEFQELLCKRNDLLEQLLKLAKEINPGETQEVKLSVKIYRRKTAQTVKHKKVEFKLI